MRSEKKTLIHHLFEKQVDDTPDRIALVFEGNSLTYAQLNEKANVLAHLLIERGARPGVLIGLSLDRRLELVIAILAILKSGAGYVPLDPTYPKDRIDLMLADSQAQILVTQRRWACQQSPQWAGNIQTVYMEDCTALLATTEPSRLKTNPCVNSGSDSIAYVIYTSGSTGTPKGVLTSHQNAVRLFEVAKEVYHFEPNDVWTLFHSYSFDFSVWELWGPLFTGAKLVIVPYSVSRSPREFCSLLAREKVTVLNQTPSAFFQLIKENHQDLKLRYVILGGESLDFSRLAQWTNVHGFEAPRLVNGYGPTEATVFTTFKVIAQNDLSHANCSNIGKPLSDLKLYLVDANLQPVQKGESGEILIAGEGVAGGYLNRPELTGEKFVTLEFFGKQEHFYRTGDLGRYLENGDLEYLGRIDHQVKIRGFRIELGEIESVLRACPEVEDGVVIAREDADESDRYLAAYVIPKKGKGLDRKELKGYLALKLPDYMVPQVILEVDQFPLNSNGKLDRTSLPAPSRRRSEIDQIFVEPTTETERLVAESWGRVLKIDKVGSLDNFFELGGTSLLAVQAALQLERIFQKEVPVIKIFENSTVQSLSKFLDSQHAIQDPKNEKLAGSSERKRSLGVAIIGMSCRFPGANNYLEFWKNLIHSKETVSFFKNEEVHSSVSPDLLNQEDYVKARGILEGIEYFDAGFFGIPPIEATLMDPQHRCFMEVAWEALESSGYGPHSNAISKAKSVGVYAGTYNNTYYSNFVQKSPELISKLGQFQTMLANEKDYVAMRTSHKLNLKGPSISLYTACSTSLVAVSQGYFGLLSGQCDLAVCGGASVTVPQKVGHLYQEGSMLSNDGHTRPFDKNAKGTVFSDGTGAVVLKRLEDAIADRDPIYGVILGAAVNNDGSERMSFSSPNIEGQASVIKAAHAHSGVHPSTISYIEAHGTATPIGDPIEVEALSQAFKAQDEGEGQTPKKYCALGSVKSNFGHLTIASGVAGLMKTALALTNEVIPATLHYSEPNPKIPFDRSPFFVSSQPILWPRGDKPRRAGVSSFGVGGTNAHVILEEPPLIAQTERSLRSKQLWITSAKTASSVERSSELIEKFVITDSKPNYEDVAYTLQTGRASFAFRKFAVVDTQGGPSKALKWSKVRKVEKRPDPIWMFPGQGSQRVGMGQSLYRTERVFRDWVDHCLELMKLWTPAIDLKSILYALDRDEAARKLQETQYTQPAIFITEFALAQLLLSWGLKPRLLIGHSIGEIVAACISGIFKIEDALRLVVERGRIVQSLPHGSMLSVRLSEELALEKISGMNLSIAAINSPSLCVIAGSFEQIGLLQRKLDEEGIICRALNTSHAFHSRMMDPAVEALEKMMAQMPLSAPQVPILSTVTGKLMTSEQAQSRAYWSRHLREPVRFSSVFRCQELGKNPLFVEVGPGTVLTTLALQNFSGGTAIASLGAGDADESGEWSTLLSCLGQMWSFGIDLDWNHFWKDEQRFRVPLPTYSFDKQRFWIEAETRGEESMTSDNVKQESKAVTSKIVDVLQEISGLEFSNYEDSATFLEMGLDSLMLTQIATALSKRFGLKITFRQLVEDLGSLQLLSDYLFRAGKSDKEEVRMAPAISVPAKPKSVPTAEVSQPFGAQARINLAQEKGLSPKQASRLKLLVEKYNKKTEGSKLLAQQNRKVLADPRVVSGFRPVVKDLVYPIHTVKSSGSSLWDVDGNQYVDMSCGFGTNFFGYVPEFVTTAIKEQLDKGMEIGPSHPLAGEVAKLFSEMTGAERVSFCSTGSEAVLGCLRLARTVSGKNLIVSFSGDYHGIFDEVIVRGSKGLKTNPAAPGIPAESVQNMLILEYGTEEALSIIRSRASEIGGVLVEPVQSRNPDLQPKAFLQELRRITEENEMALIFDEVITGFRVGPGGAQEFFGVKADLASYGKVVGGGLPMGVIAGKSAWMDSFDGGHWQFGDQSTPTVGITYFAGTYVRHPLALAAAKAVLLELKKRPNLQRELNDRTRAVAQELNAFFLKSKAPLKMMQFSSMMKLGWTQDVPFGDLLCVLMREKGIHILDQRPLFLTAAHSEADIQKFIHAFKESVMDLQESEFLPGGLPQSEDCDRIESPVRVGLATQPPVPGARLGRDREGNPAWFVADTQNPGKYLQI